MRPVSLSSEKSRSPTYNEAENLPKLVSALFALPLDLTFLVVDDNSPDGTGRLASGRPDMGFWRYGVSRERIQVCGCWE
ncbi:MAG: glycosyltransferase [Anaerolineales bacterium]|nr:glycosyltransferase [Anaerolineales bacterium]MDP3185309.1 glycosyltransferase [Anaerolineales bacterium]